MAQGLWALANLSSDEHRAAALLATEMIAPLCRPLHRHDVQMQQQILRCLAHLLPHMQAREQLAEAASLSNDFLQVLLAALQSEELDSQALQAVIRAFAVLGVRCNLHFATQLVELPGYSAMLASVVRNPESTTELTLVSALKCILNLADTLQELSDSFIETRIFVKPLRRLLKSSSTMIQESALKALDRIPSLSDEQIQRVVVETETETLMAVQRPPLPSSSMGVKTCSSNTQSSSQAEVSEESTQMVQQLQVPQIGFCLT